MKASLNTLGLGLVAMAGVWLLRDALARQGARAARPGYRFVRAAGPRQMRLRPRDWDIVDEQSDESFPASDPPGNY